MNKKQRKKILFYLATKLSWLLVLAFGTMSRVTVKNGNLWRHTLKTEKSVIYLVWHGTMLLPVYMMRNRNVLAMVSEHGDGEIIAQAILRLGYKTVRGSSSRGGSKALRSMIKEIRNGAECAILPDGPRGPRHEVKMGAIVLAQLSGAPIVIISSAAEKPIVFNSWDRFTLWRPFCRCSVAFSEPIRIPRKLTPDELETWRLFVEKRMKAMDEVAGALVQ